LSGCSLLLYHNANGTDHMPLPNASYSRRDVRTRRAEAMSIAHTPGMKKVDK